MESISSHTQPFVMSCGQAVCAECFTLSAGPGLPESGSIAVPLTLQGGHRHRHRKSITTPMNQHSWLAPLGYCAILCRPISIVSPRLHPMSGTGWRALPRSWFSFSLPFPMSRQIRAEERFTFVHWWFIKLHYRAFWSWEGLISGDRLR